MTADRLRPRERLPVGRQITLIDDLATTVQETVGGPSMLSRVRHGHTFARRGPFVEANGRVPASGQCVS
jgi:hypothetical protein